MRFKIDWASLLLRKKFTVLLSFISYLEGLIHEGTYFRNFTVCSSFLYSQVS